MPEVKAQAQALRQWLYIYCKNVYYYGLVLAAASGAI